MRTSRSSVHEAFACVAEANATLTTNSSRRCSLPRPSRGQRLCGTLLCVLLLILECKVSEQQFASELFSILLNQGSIDSTLTSVNVPEFALPGVQQALMEADKLLHLTKDEGRIGAETVLQALHSAVMNLGPANNTYPVTRRLIIAVLKSKAVALQDIAGDTFVDLSRKVHDHFYQLLKQGQEARQRLIHFFHIPKTGGTSLCKLAIEMYHVDSKRYQRMNCHMAEFNDFGSWVDYVPDLPHQFWMRQHWTGAEDSPHATCEFRERMMLQKQLLLHSNEYVLPDTDGGAVAEVCPQLTHLVMLRNPISRSVSNIMHLKHMFNWNNASDRFPSSFTELTQLAPRIVNNFYIRTLLGKQVFNLPFDAITEQHLQAAKLKLLQFDIILLLEEHAKDDLVVSKALDWHGANLAKRKFNGYLNFVPELGKDAFDRLHAADLHLGNTVYSLAQSSYLDMVLYMFARRLFEVDYAFYSSL